MTEQTTDTTSGNGETVDVTHKRFQSDLSPMAASIAREIDRLPKGKVATIMVTKNDSGVIENVEFMASELLTHWRTDTREVA